MRNSNRKIILLLILIAACGAAGYFLLLKPAPSGESVKTDSLTGDLHPDTVTEISVSGRGPEAYTITKDGDLLKLDEPSAIGISEPYLEVIWKKLLALEGTASDAVQSEEMELSDPSLLIEYREGDNTVSEVRIGRKSPLSGGYYACGAGDAVWTVDEETVLSLMGARQEFYIRNLLEFSSEKDFEQLESITLSGKDPGFTEIRVEADKTWFHLSLPFTYICDFEALKVGFLDPAVHLKGTRYVSDRKLPEYGFDDPEYTLTCHYAGEEIQILFGSRTDEGTYVCRSDRDFVYLIRDEDIAFLNASYKDLIGESVYSRNISFVDSFRITYQGHTEEFDLENAKDITRDKWLLHHNGRTYAYEEYISFYSAVMGVPIGREIEEEELPGTDPDQDVTIEVLLKSGETDEFILKAAGDREYQAVVNGECHFTTPASGAEAIISHFEKWS